MNGVRVLVKYAIGKFLNLVFEDRDKADLVLCVRLLGDFIEEYSHIVTYSICIYRTILALK